MGRSKGYRTGMAIAGLIAAIALAIRGLISPARDGPLLLGLAMVVAVAVFLRWRVYRG